VSLSEFDLIRDFFSAATAERGDVLLGVGDDCALLQPPPGRILAASMDTLVEGRHFLPQADPEGLGHKALAVNLSDLAAMGAEPAWAMLAITLPQADRDWLGAFMRGFTMLAAEHGVQLVGGDTTRGPLSLTVQVQGFVDPDRILRRSAGRAGDRLLVSGTLGDAALALARIQAGTAPSALDPGLCRRLDRPTPRVDLGRLLGGLANAAIDLSDGLLADLGHVCAASAVGAEIELERLPLSGAVAAACAAGEWQHVLSGGDDYELLFSVAPAQLDEVLEACALAGHAVKEIGRLAAEPGIRLIQADGSSHEVSALGFDHFRG
jgi:thiamine-monophosphate kinase